MGINFQLYNYFAAGRNRTEGYLALASVCIFISGARDYSGFHDNGSCVVLTSTSMYLTCDKGQFACFSTMISVDFFRNR
jgi:hypothetical protein